MDTYWFGFYGDRTNRNDTYGYIYFAPLNDDTKSSKRTYEQDTSGVYTKLTDTDSGFAVSWQNIDLDAGQSKTYSFILGVGEKADPPQWSDGKAVTLTLAADAEQNKRLVNVSARVKDAAGLTDTLYYSVDGGEGEVLGEVAADGSMKAITGQLDLSGYAEGSYLFSFWVVNSKGAASASVEREIIITADGIEGLDGDAPAGDTYDISGTVTDGENNKLSGVTVKLMQGSAVVATTTTDSQGNYSFHYVPAGLYNVAAEKEGVTKTILVELTGANAAGENIQMPEGKTSSVVEVKGSETPAVVVGGVDAVAEAQEVEAGQAVTVKLTVEKQDAPADKPELDEAVQGKKDDVLYLDLSLLKTTAREGSAPPLRPSPTPGKQCWRSPCPMTSPGRRT